MTTITIHQPEFLPWEGFFAKAKQCDKLVLFDLAQYNKQDFQNRNKFLATNKQWKWLTIPLKRHKTNTRICEIEIDNTQNWQTAFRNRIYSYYKSYSYFNEVFKLISPIWECNWNRLSMLNTTLIHRILDYLSIDIEIILSSDLVGRDYESFEKLSPTSKNLKLCLLAEGNKYISGIHGKDYLDLAMFKDNNIDVQFFSHKSTGNKKVVLSIIHDLFLEGRNRNV